MAKDNEITAILRLLDFLHQALSDSTGYLRMVVLGNASIYLILNGPERERHRTYLPHARHGAMPQHTFTAIATLTAAVETTFRQIKAQLLPSDDFI